MEYVWPITCPNRTIPTAIQKALSMEDPFPSIKDPITGINMPGTTEGGLVLVGVCPRVITVFGYHIPVRRLEYERLGLKDTER